ncbi:MAG: 1-(5-phosphoribosyl)-5-[(5-phosphoribosylamino)methylideneamino]imidazole-4-carboxamide isomerase [Bacillota bacterium]|nr:1-(5-phosphoribosyl)-5-[(5-phosphoribosylamino)methylideneamino]imidazole-4-carboxamide isomerase [Bacillota bacterium]
MIILPAIDLYEGSAVRLLKGDYNKMTVYDKDPACVADRFKESGAKWIHVVDLEGAKNGDTPNIETVKKILKETKLNIEIGGGIRSFEVIEKYLSLGVERVILGTAAVSEPDFVKEAVKLFGKNIAVGVDIKDGFVAINGWTENSELKYMDFLKQLEDDGVGTVICTDISRDGAMQGTNINLYDELASELKMNIIASGGVSDVGDVKVLTTLGLYGAIIGKAYYTGAIDLKEAIKIAEGDKA